MYKAINLDYENLEPYLSSETISIHYNKHYKSYLNKLNDILDYLDLSDKYTLKELVLNIDNFPSEFKESILYNSGGVLNHELYFKTLGFDTTLECELYEKIVTEFGSIDEFKTKFKGSANDLKGSGYTFLVIDKNDKLSIINMPNQETPYSIGLTPIMNIDLWEHAYYLDYKNDRARYIEDFFSMIDFSNVNEKYKEIQNKI